MAQPPDELTELLKASDPSRAKGPPTTPPPPPPRKPPDPPSPPGGGGDDGGDGDDDIDELWKKFLERFSRLILSVCHKKLHWEDGPMDGYAYVLDHLRANDFARLRKYSPCPGCKFETWLTTVVGRLCIDCWREHYKIKRAPKGEDPNSPEAIKRKEEQELAKRIADLLAKDLEVIAPPPSEEDSAEDQIVRAEMQATLLTCVASLPARDRLMIKLRFLDGATAAEVAKLMKFPTQWHVFRAERAALAALRACFAAKGITRR
jgi:RNA polymerase sigma factor (sigma-70 family)